ncbi:unnamed protein product, partial [marine sediment metagenome]
VIIAFLSIRASMNGTPRIEADPKAETAPNSGMLVAIPR